MIRQLRLSVALILLALAASAAPAARRAEHVFIVSFDGGNPTVMRESKVPNINKLVAGGAVTWNAQTVLPSVTLISHTSMLTGVVPKKHKMLWDDYEPDKGVVKVPTIFGVAKHHGLVTGLIAGKDKFKHLDVPGTLDYFAIPSYYSGKCAAAAANFIAKRRPNLCFIHFGDTDGAGHKYGWGSPEQKQAFTEEDRALGTVLKAIAKAGIANSSVVIVTADHGGHKHIHGTKNPADMTIPWIAYGPAVKTGYQIRGAVSTCDTAATALWLLDLPIPPGTDGKPVTEAFR